MKRKLRPLFPTLILEGSLRGSTALNRCLLTEISSLQRRDKMGREWSRQHYRQGYTSYASLSDLHHRSPVFQHFEKSLQPHAEAFATAQGWNLKGMALTMNACWINVMSRNTYHTLHLHPHSVISGAYYVSTPPGSVALKIEDPRMAFYMNAPLREKAPKNQALYHEVGAKAGMFVLFESWVRHEVPPNRSKSPRVSISFNYSLEPQEI